jgi:hypothetical protein
MLVEVVGLAAGLAVIVGVGGPEAPKATAAHSPPPARQRTASSATSGLRMALPDAVLKTLRVT